MKIAVLSGAGLSKASGIPTYRDAGGLWMADKTAKFSSKDELVRDPEGFKQFWADRAAEISKAAPNAAHLAFAELESLHDVTHATQNIDGLLSKAGCSKVLELHGSLSRPWLGERPDVVMFGEQLNQADWQEARAAFTNADFVVIVGTTGGVYPAASLPKLAWLPRTKVVIINPEPTELDHLGATMRMKAEHGVPRLVKDLLGQ